MALLVEVEEVADIARHGHDLSPVGGDAQRQRCRPLGENSRYLELASPDQHRPAAVILFGKSPVDQRFHRYSTGCA
jgi:hypothetical protein